MGAEQRDAMVVLQRTFATSRKRLFAAWTDPVLLARWWAPPGANVTEVELDLRVGGRYRIGLVQGDSQEFHVSGEYVEIQPPYKLAFTWRWERPEMDIGESTVTLDFFSEEDDAFHSQLTLTHSRLPTAAARSSHREGWTGILANLDIFVHIDE